MTSKSNETKNMKTFGDTIGARAFPEAGEVTFDSIVGQQIIIKDVAEREFKHGPVAIILFSIPNTEGDWTCVSGGEVVRKKLLQARDDKLLPLLGTISMEDGKDYYDIV